MLFAPAFLQPAVVWSAAPPCAVKGKGYDDPDISVVNGGIEIADAVACQAMCAKSPTCKVFTFYITSGGCWLQGMNGMTPPLEPIAGVMSGPKVCPDSGDDDSEDLGASPADSLQRGVVVTDSPADASQKGVVVADAAGKADAHAGGFPIWAGVMMALLAIVGAVVGFYVFRGEDKKKGASKQKKSVKQRGVELSESSFSPLPVVSAKDAGDVESPLIASSLTSTAVPLSPASTTQFAVPALPLPTVTSTVPTYVSVAQPGVRSASEALPMVATPKVVTRAVPQIVSSRVGSATFSMASASFSVAAPVQQQHVVVRQTKQEDLFDRLDTNHDGVITRDEFSALAR